MHGTTAAVDMSTLTRADGLWFEDGNLILQAEQTLFRIYRGLLCARSSVFGDMFAFPPPAEGNMMFDGCPIVQTYDSAQDMGFFLRAVLDSDFFEAPPSQTTMPILEGVLRLSTKYDVRYLRQRAMAHLLTTYPTTLAGWKARDTARTIPSVENTPFVVLNLAREFDMPWLVPSVAYCISSHDINKTLDGAPWAGKTQAQGYGGGVDMDVDVDGREGVVKLGWADIKMCIKGRNNILVRQNAMALSFAKGSRRAPNSAQQAALVQAAAAAAAAAGVAPAPAAGAVGGAITPGGNPANPGTNGFPGMIPNFPANVPIANTAVPAPPAQAGGAVVLFAPAPAAAAPVVPPAPAAGAAAALSPAPSTTTSCPAPDQCAFTRFRCAEILSRWGTAGFLDFFDEQQEAFAPGFCEGCLEAFRGTCERASEEMWEALPSMFGLEEWEALERARGFA
ncbi:hypothetical protein D9611_010135 [Ephemerocybe angulata]|uniref:BTB domain-containing protein n=1 Tax=Ephemerocybe angulata TaxID=980116 RepID=A0A8H5AYX9_9AGAR|nr:hypothetical protein D9611_010135 [Tulosesus angulatus]